MVEGAVVGGVWWGACGECGGRGGERGGECVREYAIE